MFRDRRQQGALDVPHGVDRGELIQPALGDAPSPPWSDS
jgi:hypothetical protein